MHAISAIERSTMRKVAWRLLPFLIVCYFISYLDRVNVGFAGPAMRADLGLSATAFGTAAGIFFLAYFAFEVPSNLALNRFGARIWIARIMITWGILSGAQAFVTGPTSFNIVRVLLGAAEAGFFPGVIFYLTLWFPSAYRGRIVGWFMFAIPFSSALGSPVSGYLLNMDGIWGLHGWQWMFIIEAIPALLMTGGVLWYLTDRPSEADWLTVEEKAWLSRTLAEEESAREAVVSFKWWETLLNPRIIGYGLVYLGLVSPLYTLGFFQPQIIKALGNVSNVQLGFLNAFPYAVGAVTMVLWGFFSDRIKERKWTTIFAAACATAGLLIAASNDGLVLKLIGLALASYGIFAALPIFWSLPTAMLSGVAAAAGIAWINSVGNLGGYFGPQVFGIIKDRTGGDYYGLLFMAALPIMSIVLVMILDRKPLAARPAAAPAE
ncbi:MFS transporter [Roseomonas sp. 18066]|uniref:MFS transporter n=1 Tax=Roseomonas sp. 18066 TaxID=2681412 RepID=UPI001F23D6AB|nr:MFS transporter [Roseomonas sp. 18066]